MPSVLTDWCNPATFIVTLVLLAALPVHAAERLRIAAASSITPLLESFQAEHTDRQFEITSAASGVLHAQALRGAPYDILLVADPRYLDDLQQRKRILPDHRHCIAVAPLALVTSRSDRGPALDLLDPANREPLSLVIADPNLAPVGQASRQILQRYGAWPAPQQSTLILARSAAQTAQLLVTRHADLGILPIHLARRHGLDFSRIPAEWHSPIRYEAALLNRSATSPTELLRRLAAHLRTDADLQNCAPGNPA